MNQEIGKRPEAARSEAQPSEVNQEIGKRPQAARSEAQPSEVEQTRRPP